MFASEGAVDLNQLDAAPECRRHHSMSGFMDRHDFYELVGHDDLFGELRHEIADDNGPAFFPRTSPRSATERFEVSTRPAIGHGRDLLDDVICQPIRLMDTQDHSSCSLIREWDVDLPI